MTAIVSGNNLGLLNSSLYVLGSQGALGQATQGRSGEQVFVNGSTGNLVIQNRDELVIGRGPDLSLLRTYNSQGLFDGDNNDNWRFGVYRKVTNLTGTVNTAGSTVTRVAEDGSESLYTYDATLGKYVCHDGGGSFDTLSFASATQTWTWSWSDGTNQLTELYDNANGGRITKAQDQDGNSLTFTYNAAGLITQVSDANGESTFLDYTGTNLTQLRTVNSGGQTLVRTRYAYDASNRLTTVTTDLSPEDASVADGKTYVVNYTYDGTSKRVATLTQTDGNNLSFTYIQVGSDWKVASFTDVSGTTSLSYTQGTGSVPASATANNAVLSTTVTSSTNFNLITGALTAPTAAWGTASLRESLTTASATSPQVSFDQNGNGMAVWALGAELYYSTYSKNTDTWSAAATLEGTLTGNPTKPDLAMSANGNAIVTWVQNNNIYARRYIAGVWDGASTIPNLENLTGAAVNPVAAINDNGRAVVAFIQAVGTTNNLYTNVYNGTAWQTAATAVDDIGTANGNSITNTTVPSVAIDPSNNATVLWLQKTGTQTADSLYFSRFAASTGTWSAPNSTTLENTTTAVTAESIAFDGSGNGIAIWLQGGSLLAKSYTAATNAWSTTATTLSTATATVPNLSMSANGNGLVTWIQGANVVARRYAGGAWIGTAPSTLENLTTTPLNPVGSINNAGQAVVVFVQPTSGTTNSLYANRFDGTAWQTAATLIESSGNSIAAGMVPSGAIDSLGDVNAVWLQKNGTDTTDSVFSNRFTSATSGSFYLVKSTDSWNSIATALYGSASVASALQTAMGNPTLAAGLRLSGFPATLTGTTTTTVAPYYTVVAGDTWASIAQTVYGDAQAAGALQTALGNPALTAGAHLNVPQTLSYTRTITAAVQADITDPLGLVTSLFYDASGQITRVLTPAVGGVRLETLYAYDASGNVASVTDAKGNVVTYGYDANGNRILERDAAGNTITRLYDSNNELLAETSYLVPDPDGAGAAQPASPLTSRYAYDANGHLRFAVSAEGRVSEYRYNAFGQRIAAIQYTGALFDLTGLTPTSTLTEANLTAFVGTADKTKTLRADSSFDFRGLVSSTTSYTAVDALGNGVADGTQSVTQYVYDQTGNLLKTVDPRGVATPADPNDFTATYVYDGLGRRLSSTDALGHITLNQYDDANRKTVMTLANGLVTTSIYDAKGELVSVVQSSDAQSLGTTSYFYDADGRLRRTVDPTGIGAHILYDEAGRTVASIDGDGSLTEYRYDANSNVTKTMRYATLVSAANLASLVDAQGKPTNVTLAAIRPAGGASDRVNFAAYDAANRLVKMVDEAGFVTQNFYDGAGRLTDALRFATAISTATLTDTPAPASINPASSAADRLSRTFYDAQGKLRGSLDGEGFLVEYKYDAAGELVETVGYATATNAALRATGTLAQLVPAASANDIHSFALYNAKGQVAGVVDGEGYLTENVYDLAGNKTQVISYATRVAYTAGATLASLRPAANAQDQTTSTVYTPLNQLASITTADGTLTNYFYDEVGTVVKTVKAAGTNPRTLLTQYDKLGRITAELSANGAAQLTGNQTQAEIDAIWAAYATKYTYDAAGRRTSSTDADGRKALYFYNADGRLTHAIDALGEVTESAYNALGQVVQSTQYGTRLSAATLSTLSGGLVNAALTAAVAGIANAALDSKTTTSYTTTGRVAQTVDALGNATTQAFDAFGEVTASSQAIGGGLALDHTYAYDHRGLLTLTVWDPAGINTSASTVYDAFGRAIQSTDARGNVSTNTYDRLGHTIASTDRLNQTSSQTFDAFGRVLTQTDPLGKTTTFAYNIATRTVTVTSPEGVVTTTVKNRHGQTVSVTDGRGNATTYQYDKDGNLIRVDAPAGATTYAYDNADLLIETVDENGVKTDYTYDAANRVLTRTLDPGAGRLNLVTSYAYDAKGQTVSATDARGVVTQTTFDLKGEVTSVVVDPGAGHLNLTTTYAYDARGKKLTMTEGAGSASPRVTQYTYDKLGRLTQQRVDPSGINATTAYVYDKNGNVTKKTDANGNVTRYAYDADDRLVYTANALGGVSKNDYDADGRVTRVTGYANAISLAGLSDFPSLADISSRITASGGDETKSYVYDGDGREVFCIDALGGVTQKFYDANGNVVRSVVYANPIPVTTALTQAAVAAALTPNAAKDEVTRTVYDAANRAVYAIDAGNFVKETQYDATGRITRTIQYTPSVVVSATPTAAEVAAAVAADANEQVSSFIYDAGGRLSSSTDAEGFSESYAYDALGNPVSFTNKKGAVWNYVYDAAGRLTSELTPSVDVTSVVDNSGTISASSTSARIETRIAYDAFGNVLSRTEAFGRPEARTTQYAYDALGRQIRTTFPTVNVYNAAGDDLTTNGVSGTVTRAETAATPTSTTYYDALGNAVASKDTSGAFSYKIYDALGRVIYEIDAGRFVTAHTYDAFGDQLTLTRFASPLGEGLFTAREAQASATTIQALTAADVLGPQPAWTQDFSADASGLVGDGITSGTMSVTGGRLVTTTQAGAATTTPGLLGTRNYSVSQAPTFHSEVTTTTSNGRWFLIGADNAGTVGGTNTYRRMSAFFSGGTLYANYYDPTNTTNPWITVALGAIKDNTTYNVDVRVDAAGATLNVYEAGKTPSSGFFYTRAEADWGIARSELWTLINPGQPANTTFVDNLRETTGTSAPWVYAQDFSSGSAGLTGDGLTNPAYMQLTGGRLMTQTQNVATTVFPNLVGTRSYSATQPTVFHSEVTTTTSNGRWLLIGAQNDGNAASGTGFNTYRRMTAGFFGNTVYAHYYDQNNAASPFPSVALGTIKDNTTYNVDVQIDATGATLYVWEAGTDRSTGFSYFRADSSWGNARSTMWTLGAAGQPNSVTYVDNLREFQLLGALAPSASDRTITTSYDRLNHATQVVQPAVFTFDSTAPAGSPQTFTAGATTRNTYNAFGQLIKQSTLKNPGADLQVGSADDTWVDTYFYYDARGNKIAQVDALGFLTTSQYDETDDLVRQVQYAKALAAGTWSTAGFGTPVATTPQANPGSAIGYDREITYQYDRKNQKIGETRVNAEFGTVTGTLTLGTTAANLTTGYGYDGVGNLTSVTDPTGATTYTYYDVLGRVVATAEPARFSDGGNGTVAMPTLNLSYNPATNSTTITFAKTAPTDTTVALQYRVAGTTAWTTAPLQVQGTATFAASITGVAADRYDYQLTYTRAGDPAPYATGAGQFNIIGPSSAASVNVVAAADSPSVSPSGIIASAHYDQVPGAEGGFSLEWNGSNSVSLSWSSLAALGNGNVHVRLNYQAYQFSRGALLGAGGNTSVDLTFAAADANTGATLNWTDVEGLDIFNAGVLSINSVQIWKVVNGVEVPVINSAPGVTQPDRLLILGNTAGLTGINVAGVGTLAATSLGGGVFSVNVAGLSRGSYTFTPVGTASAVGGAFDVTHSSAAGRAGVQEVATITQTPAAPPDPNRPGDQAFGSPGTPGSPTSTINRTLNAYNLPANAASAVLQYRPSGSTGPFLSKTLNAAGPGEFSIPYDDVANGSYEFILTVRDLAGNLIDLTSAGGTAAGTISGTIKVRRGGELPTVTATANALTLTPLTVTRYDSLGNTVQVTKFAKGAVNADTSSYGLPSADANDQTTFNFFDALGHITRAVDPEGASKFSSYDVLGRVAKTWMPITNNDAQVNNAIQVFQYDKLGQQTATIEPSFLPFQPGVPLNPANFATNQARYNAFGEVTSKGLNDGAQEYFQYDNAGHLWRTNEKDGANKVFLYDLQGKTTSQILSQTLDLLNGFSGASQVAALTGSVERTDTRYDALERATQQVTPTFAVQQAVEAYPSALTMVNASLSVNSYSAAHYDSSEFGFVWSSGNSISLSWNDLSFLGGGNVLVTVDYINANGTAGAFSQEFASSAAASGVSMSWDVDERTGGGFGTPFESRVRVWKRDVSGNLVAIFDQAGTGSVNNLVTSIMPTEVGTGVSANFKTAAGTTFAPIAIFNMGNRYLVNTLSLGANTYDLDVLYTRPGGTTPYAHASGRLAKSGGGITNTTAPTNVSFLSMTPTMTQTLDRWGNALAVTDARGLTTNYRYNYLDGLVEEDLPLTDVWGANGVDTVTRPVVRNFYDKAGRGLGTIDANGNATTARYDGGGQLIAEFHADGGVLSYQYDAFGRRTRVVDTLGKITDSVYDRDNRLTKLRRPIGEENYAYDQAGNRIRVTNAAGELTKYWYDTRGKLIRSQIPGGQQTNDFYDLRGNKIREVTANGDQPVWSYDYFGHMLTHTDMGGGVYGFSYDKAGRITQQTLTRGASSGVTTFQYYENGLLKRAIDSGVGGETFYEYDAAGNRTRERYVKGGTVFQDDRMTYDELGRLKTLKDNRIQLTTYKYDANGNRRNVHSDYFDSNNVLQHLDSWYLYDGMNRIALSQGVLAGGVIQINASQGVQLQYDAASNRRAATSFQSGALVAESYNYDDNGRLTTTSRGGQLTSSRAYDLAGRVTQQISYSSPGVINERRQATYNINGQVTQQQIFNSAGTLTQTTNYTGYDAMGNVTSYNINVPVQTAFTNFYSYTYAKFDIYKEQNVAGSSTFFQPGNTTTTYDINGNVLTVSDQFATSKFRSFVTDGSGDILQKTENGQTQYYFFANDKPIGSTGALGAADFDYNYTPVSDLYPATAPSRYVVSKGDTLRSIALAVFGDAQLWYVIADANGMRSDADLKVGQQLVIPNKISNLHNDSQTFKVVLPSETIGDTTPTLPDPPPPPQPHHGGCGGFGAILVAIVSVVVAIILPIAAPAIFGAQAGILGAVGTAVLSNLAGQVTANIIGLQHGINFGSIAASALSAGITFGILGGTGAPGTPGAPTEIGQAIGQVGRAVVGNVVSQGVNIVLGQQHGFSWAAVAGAAVTAGITQAVTEGLNGVPGEPGYTPPSPFNSAVASFAGGLAGGVVRAVLSGGRINFAQIAADAFGNALGTFIGQSIADSIGQQRQALALAQQRAAQADEPPAQQPAPQILGVAPQPGPQPDPNLDVAEDLAAQERAIRQAQFEQEVSENIDQEDARIGAEMRQRMLEQDIAEAQDREQMQLGAAMQALVDQDRANTETANAAVARAEQYAAEGLDFQGKVIQAGDQGAHTFLPLLMADTLGIRGDPRVQRFMGYMQFSDQVSALDAATNGARYYLITKGDSLGMLNDLDPADAQQLRDLAAYSMLSESSLHSLNGQPWQDSARFYMRLITGNTYDGPFSNAVQGLAGHGLVDAPFHADPNGIDYDAPWGHTTQGHDQDYIKFASREQVFNSMSLLMTAFETIAGRRFTQDERETVWVAVNGALDRARDMTQSELPWNPFSSVNPNQRMEYNFRQVVTELGLTPSYNMVKLPDYPAGGITEELTLEQGRTFWGNMPAAQADELTRQGMAASAFIMNSYQNRFYNRTIPEPANSRSLYDVPFRWPR